MQRLLHGVSRKYMNDESEGTAVHISSFPCVVMVHLNDWQRHRDGRGNTPR